MNKCHFMTKTNKKTDYLYPSHRAYPTGSPFRQEIRKIRTIINETASRKKESLFLQKIPSVVASFPHHIESPGFHGQGDPLATADINGKQRDKGAERAEPSIPSHPEGSIQIHPVPFDIRKVVQNSQDSISEARGQGELLHQTQHQILRGEKTW